MLYDSSWGFVHLDIPSGFWPICHPGKTEDSSANTYGHTCLCDSSTKPTVSPGSNSTWFATVSPMSNIERKSASGKQGPPQSSIGVHSTHPLIRSCASSTWPACPRRSTMLHFSRNTTKLTSWIQKELQAFLWIPGLHGYKLAHACDHLKKTQFGSLYSLATFAEKTSFHGLLTFLPSHAIPPKPCIPSRHMAIKPRCRCSQLLFSHTQAPCA
jgi:hypothetical protein